MAIQKWNPFRELSSLRREMDDIYDRFLGDIVHPTKHWSELSLAADIKETDNEIIVNAELPGMDSKDISITLENDTLTIRGEKKQEKEEKTENFLRVERSYGTFQRSFTLPCKVEEEKIAADYKNGVLRITLPKSESGKRKAIQIKVK